MKQGRIGGLGENTEKRWAITDVMLYILTMFKIILTWVIYYD